jgi:hypothetical protein
LKTPQKFTFGVFFIPFLGEVSKLMPAKSRLLAGIFYHKALVFVSNAVAK